MAKSKRPQHPAADALESPDEDRELSLDALSAAFAEALAPLAGEPTWDGFSTRPELDHATESGASAPIASTHPSSAGKIPKSFDPIAGRTDEPIIEADSRASSPGDDRCEISPRSILEALLFVGDPAGGAIPVERLAGVMRGVEPAELDGLVRELNQRYDEAGAPYRIVGEASGYRLSLRPEFARIRDKFFGKVKQARLSQIAVDVLALVAYHQPLSAEEIGRLRGVSSGSILSQLVRRQLLSVERPDPASRVIHYRTTRRFLDVFGLSSLDDLPTSRDLDEK